MATIKQVSESTHKYTEGLSKISIPQLIHLTLSQAQDKEYLWKLDWASKPGVYLFFKNDQIKYVGRALTTTLANRIFEQSTAFGDPKWDAVIKDPNTTIAVIVLEVADAHITASLEAYLIAEFRSELVNLRSS